MTASARDLAVAPWTRPRGRPGCVVNGRYYDRHESRRLYSVQGPGLVTLDQGAYRALAIYSRLGETPPGEQVLDYLGDCRGPAARRTGRQEAVVIWRYMFVDAGADALASGLACACGVDAERVGVVAARADGTWPDWVQGYEVVAETVPARGEARLMATLFVFRDAAEVERLDDHAVARALADALGCTVFLPDEKDANPFNYWRLCPHQPTERVALDPDGEDEEPLRVTVTGPARSWVPEGAEVPKAAE